MTPVQWLILFIAVIAVVSGTIAAILLSSQKAAIFPPTDGITAVNGTFVRDLQHASKSFSTGDTLILQHVSTGAGAVRWEFSVGDKPFRTALESTTDNPARWKIPSDVYGDMKLRVSSLQNLTLSATTAAFRVTPAVVWTGLGDVAARHLVVIGDTAEFAFVQTGKWITGDVKVELIDQFSKAATEVPQADLTLDVQKSTLSWHVTGLASGLYNVRFTTTNLKAQNYPDELTYTTTNAINVQDNGGYNNAGSWGSVSVVHASNRRGGFAPSETVSLTFTIPVMAAHDWYYFDTSINTWVVITTGANTDTTAWTLPRNLDGSVRIRAVPEGTLNPDSSADFAETTINIGIYIVPFDTAGKVTINFNGLPEIVTPARLQICVVGSVDQTLANVRNWTVGWLVKPDESTLDSRVFAADVVSVEVASGGSTIPQNTTWIVIQYHCRAPKAPITDCPLYIQCTLDGFVPVVATSQKLYTLVAA